MSAVNTRTDRPDNLAMILQEALTATVRLRTGRQSVTDAQAFRSQMREALKQAQRQARTAGYSDTSVSLAIFAVVAFLDESVLNLQNPAFGSWPGRPLQDELFGGHVAGETFFENLTRLLAQDDSTELADVLEVYELCLLLGYRGRYALTPQGELNASIQAVRHKIDRIRGRLTQLAPNWAPPSEAPPAEADPWGKRLALAAVASLVLVVILFLAFSFSLNSGLADLRALTVENDDGR